MGLIEYNRVIVMGNFAKISKKKPKRWWLKDYKVIVPFDFKWRHKVGNVKCSCKTCIEHHQPYLGFSWYHSDDCDLIKHVKKHPGILNLRQYYDWDYRLIAQTE